jgi:SEC-C motif-containing protein
MRSRYSAFAAGQVDHLWRTLHPQHEDHGLKESDVKRSLKRMCNRSTFPRLTILSTEEADATGAAFVTFHAVVMDHGVDVGFVERSEFRQDGGAWKYVRGDMKKAAS